MKPVKAAIVGLGWWGKKLVEAVQPHDTVLRFVRGVTHEPESVIEFAATHGLSISDHLDTVLTDPEIQAVVLATPHSLHPAQIIASARAGKAVFCEKPLALTVAQARQAISACQEAGVVLAIGHNRRFWPSMLELGRLTHDGHLGQVLHLEGHFSNENSSSQLFSGWRYSDTESPAGGLTSCGLHLIDAFVGLMGRASSVYARLSEQQSAPTPLDTLSVMIEFESGASGVLNVVRSTPRYWRVHVFGTAASAEVVGEQEPALIIRSTNGSVDKTDFRSVDTLRVELETFAAAVIGGPSYPISPRQMLYAVEITEAAIQSIQTGKQIRMEQRK